MKTPLTTEQKKWYLIGYVTAESESLAESLKITKEQARELLLEELKTMRGAK